MGDDSLGLPVPYTETGHETKVEINDDRLVNRVVCMECPWFLHDASLSWKQLRDAGRRHTSATKVR